MKTGDIEPGGIYEGRTGQRREVISTEPGWVTYRMLDRGYKPMPKCLLVGQIGSVEMSHFAQWATREVTDSVWALKIEGASPSQNIRDKQHWGTKTREKSRWWWLIRACPNFLSIPRATGKRRLTIERHARTVPQDHANVHGGCKGIVDDLVQLGLLVDDSPAWIEHGTPRHVRLAKGEKPYTVLILEEVHTNEKTTARTVA